MKEKNISCRLRDKEIQLEIQLGIWVEAQTDICTGREKDRKSDKDKRTEIDRHKERQRCFRRDKKINEKIKDEIDTFNLTLFVRLPLCINHVGRFIVCIFAENLSASAMVLIQDGSSGYSAHAWSKQGYSCCERQLLTSTVA